MKNFFLIAKIISASGKEGFVKTFSYSDFPDRFKQLKKVYIDFFGDKKEFTVEAFKTVKNSTLLKFKNFDDDEVVKVLIDKEIYVDSENLVKLPENTYFIHDLIGSEVIWNNNVIGIIKDVLSAPANDIYVIKTKEGKEKYFPAVAAYIKSFDPLSKILEIMPDFDINDEN